MPEAARNLSGEVRVRALHHARTARVPERMTTSPKSPKPHETSGPDLSDVPDGVDAATAAEDLQESPEEKRNRTDPDQGQDQSHP